MRVLSLSLIAITILVSACSTPTSSLPPTYSPLSTQSAQPSAIVPTSNVQPPTPVQRPTFSPTKAAASACESATPFSVSPIALSDLISITPLGNLSPPAHTFPTSHMYFQVPLVNGASDGRMTAQVPVFAPGKMTLTSARAVKVTNARSGKQMTYDEYSLGFTVCGKLMLTFGHVGPVSEKIQAALTAAAQPRCNDYTTGPDSVHACLYVIRLDVAAGEQIALSSGRAAGIDLGAFDDSKQQAFIHPERYHGEMRFNLCPLDLFEPPMRTQLMAKVADFNGKPKTKEPICGSVNQDVAGTTQGNWFKDVKELNIEDNNLALVHDVFDPAKPVFSIGNSLTGLASGTYNFALKQSGTINRDFNMIKPDGQVYCFEELTKGNARANIIILLTLDNAETLRIEARRSTSCAGTLTLSESAVIYYR